MAAALVGAVGGASVGGFLGMLVGLGLPHHAAQEYERALREGRTLVIVHPDGRYFEAEAALNHAHPSGLHRYDEPIGAAAHPPADVAEGGIELAAPDRSLNPGDVAVAIEGQQVMGHGQYQDAADLHNPSGAKDT